MATDAKKAKDKPDSKLGRTLMELESALSDWDSLSLKGGKGKQAKRPAAPSTSAETQNDKEFRKKTKKLLLQLRQQLKDLED